MILKAVLELSNSINNNRKEMYKLAKDGGLSDPNILKISQKLDGDINVLQQLMSKHQLSRRAL
ncbi:aspartyl-phosphate phosphatase Spo0E family protein [Priestia megaterium]|uniref:aspartyl-phosphate phosphatase Spo0E family protein n=1 Tax=Priestia megaterium TaxID=1404 RepID=UPI002446D61F|nr:aspartyl-phosphate phosphatase Spo0E family protein [Priestia megaterium]MDH2363318.1 aspartyl-phosphate phosphatase Spo0E family protein [Priestia megaterium]